MRRLLGDRFTAILEGGTHCQLQTNIGTMTGQPNGAEKVLDTIAAFSQVYDFFEKDDRKSLLIGSILEIA
jgi:hypothetical protein